MKLQQQKQLKKQQLLNKSWVCQVKCVNFCGNRFYRFERRSPQIEEIVREQDLLLV